MVYVHMGERFVQLVAGDEGVSGGWLPEEADCAQHSPQDYHLRGWCSPRGGGAAGVAGAPLRPGVEGPGLLWLERLLAPGMELPPQRHGVPQGALWGETQRVWHSSSIGPVAHCPV